jgi:hypothetical protein
MVHQTAPLTPFPFVIRVCSPTVDGYPHADRCELTVCVVCQRGIWVDPATPVPDNLAGRLQFNVCNDEACWGLFVRRS